jgi:hypothetical protein
VRPAAPRVAPLPRVLMLGGTALRLAYGAGSLLAPAKMVSTELAPDTHGLDDPRLLLRAFGGHQLLIGGFTLAVLRRPRLARTAARMSLLLDALDVGSALLELRARGRADQTVVGGIALSGAGVLTFAAALRALER